MTPLFGSLMNQTKIDPYALLIDGENIHASSAGEIFEKLSNYNLAIKKVFTQDCTQWKKMAERHGIERIVPTAPGNKNVVDISLTIHAMKLLSGKLKLRGFFIASSDGDFSQIAREIQNAGLEANVISKDRMRSPNLASYYTNIFTIGKPDGKKNEAAKSNAVEEKIVKLLIAMSPEAADEERWISLTALGKELKSKHPKLLLKNGLKKICKAIKEIEVDETSLDHARVRITCPATPKPEAIRKTKPPHLKDDTIIKIITQKSSGGMIPLSEVASEIDTKFPNLPPEFDLKKRCREIPCIKFSPDGEKVTCIA